MTTPNAPGLVLDPTNPPAKLKPIDLSPWRHGNTGIAYAATIAAERPGPHTLIMALMHGNELCGAHAIAFLHSHNVQPVRGRITLAFANVAAYDTFDCRQPGDARFLDEDMNRVWHAGTLNGQRTSRELSRARELHPLVESADYLLDLHAMENTGPPLVLAGLTERALDLAIRMGVHEYIVRDGGHANGTRLRDYGPFSAHDGDHTALLVECGQREHPDSAKVAIDVSVDFLACLDLISEDTRSRLSARNKSPVQRIVDVTHAVTAASDNFVFLNDVDGFQMISQAGTIIACDGDQPVQTPYDNCVLVMPSREAVAGQTAVRFGRYLQDQRQ